jgi:hypothetical protein
VYQAAQRAAWLAREYAQVRLTTAEATADDVDFAAKQMLAGAIKILDGLEPWEHEERKVSRSSGRPGFDWNAITGKSREELILPSWWKMVSESPRVPWRKAIRSVIDPLVAVNGSLNEEQKKRRRVAKLRGGIFGNHEKEYFELAAR